MLKLKNVSLVASTASAASGRGRCEDEVEETLLLDQKMVNFWGHLEHIEDLVVY